MPFYLGNLDSRNQSSKIELRPSPSYSILEMIIGTFDGFGNKSILSLCSQIRFRGFLYFPICRFHMYKIDFITGHVMGKPIMYMYKIFYKTYRFQMCNKGVTIVYVQ